MKKYLLGKLFAECTEMVKFQTAIEYLIIIRTNSSFLEYLYNHNN